MAYYNGYDEEEEYNNYSGYKGIYSPQTSFGRKFAEKSRYDAMINQMDDETKYRYVNDPSYRYEVDKSFGFKQKWNNPIFQDSKYLNQEEEGTEKRGALTKLLDFMQTGNYTSAGIAYGLAKGESLGEALDRGVEGFKAGFTGNKEHQYHYSDVLNMAGFEKESNPNGKWYNPLSWNPKNVVHNVAGFAGDVLLDPTTYLGVGLADDVVRGTGKVMKGAVVGSDDIVKTVGKGLGKRSIVKEATEDEILNVLKKTKGADYIPDASEVSDLIRRTNELRGIRDYTPLTAFGKTVIGGDTMKTIREPLRAFGDKTIAPYMQSLGEVLQHSSLFSSKGAMIDLARTDPASLKNLFDFMDEAGKHGLSYAKGIDYVQKKFGELGELNDDVQKSITTLLDDKKLYDNIGKAISRETTDAYKNVYKGEQTDMFDNIDNVSKTNTESIPSDIRDYLTRTQDESHFKGYTGYRKPNTIPDVENKVAVTVDDGFKNTNGKLPNPYEHREKILNKGEIASKYGIDEKSMPSIIKNRSGDLIDTNTGEVVNFLNKGYLENASMTELKEIGRNAKITNYSKYTNDNKGQLIDAIKAKYDIKTPLKEARSKIINADDYAKYVTLNGKKVNSLSDIPGFKTEEIYKHLTFDGKEQLLKDIVEKDKWYGNMLKHFKNNDVLFMNMTEREMDDVLRKYFNGETKGLISTTHRFHKDYPKALKVVNDEIGSWSKLDDVGRAKRMNRIWYYYNNPNELTKKYNILQHRNFGQNQVAGELAYGNVDREVESLLRGSTFTDLNTGKKWNVAGNTADYAPTLERQIYDQNKALSDLANSRVNAGDGIRRDSNGNIMYSNVKYKKIGDELVPIKSDKYEAVHDYIPKEYAGTKITDDGIKFNNKALNKSYRNGSLSNVDPEALKVLDNYMTQEGKKLPESLSLRMIESELTGRKLTTKEVMETFNQLKYPERYNKIMSEVTVGNVNKEVERNIDKALKRNNIHNVSVDNVNKLNNLNQTVSAKDNVNIINQIKELNTKPKAVQESILNPPKEVKDVVSKINGFKDDKYVEVKNLIDRAEEISAKTTNKSNNVADVVARNVVNDEKIVKDAFELTDDMKLAYKYAKELRIAFKDIGAKEVAIGKLNQKAYDEMMDSYVSHIITPEAKGLIEGLKKTNPDMYNLLSAGNKANKFGFKRKFTKGLELPDGYILKEGTIKEINDHMKQYLNGNNLFADKVSDIYLSRMLSHEAVMYDYKVVDDMVGKFGTVAKHNDILAQGESSIVKTSDIKNALRNASKEDKAKFYSRIGIEEGYFEKTMKPFMKLDNTQFNYFKKSKSIPVYKVNEIMVNKADKLAKNQMATDTHTLLKLYDKFLGLWKTQVTAVRPGFHFRNAQSNAFQNYLDVGVRSLNPMFNSKMMDVVAGKEGVHRILGKKYSYQELRDKAIQYGVVDKGFFEKELNDSVITKFDGKINPKYNPLNTKEFVVYKAGRQVGSAVENQARMANFVANLERGKSFQEASEHVNKFLFDYSDLTDFEHNVMRRIIPFYTWMRKNVPLQLEQLATNSRMYTPVAKLIDNIDNNIGEKRPDYAMDWTQLPYTVKDKDNKEYYVMWNSSLPINDLQKVASPREMWGGISPFIKIPVELIAGKNIYFGSDIKGKRAEYAKEQIPGVYEANKLSKSSGEQKKIVISDNLVGSGLKTLETEKSKEKSKKENEKDRFHYIYQQYLKNKKKE